MGKGCKVKESAMICKNITPKGTSGSIKADS
jgi:hypothetical protein